MVSIDIRLFYDIQSLELYYKQLSKERGTHVSVSIHTPFLSNLNVIENIALIEEIHQRFDRVKSHHNAMKKMQLLDLEHLATQHPSKCSEIEKFSLALIRASMMRDVTIVIITPLVQYPSQAPIEQLEKIMQILAIQKRTIILDLTLYENDYNEKGLTCHTIA